MAKILALALIVLSTSATAESGSTSKPTVVDAAYEQMANGNMLQVVARLRDSERDASADPSRLINLGTAYARLGRVDDAMRVYKAAATSSERYDIELADGTMMDSHAVARLAMKRLAERNPSLRIADVR
jgi:Tfp pilus assembly protein PilF